MNLKPWLFLLAAVSAEVIGVVMMKLSSNSDSFAPLLLTYALIGLSFYLLSKTMKYVSMAVSYAAWETVGLISIAAISAYRFGEPVTPMKLFGFSLLLAGVVIVINGSAQRQDAKP